MSTSSQPDHQLVIAGQRHPQDPEELAFGLLNGFIENDYLHFWEDRSPEEKCARAALADILRSSRPLSQFLRNQLAALIAPKGKEVQVVKRRIKFEYVDAGSPNVDYKNSVISKEIYDAIASDTKVTAAVKCAAEKHNLSDRLIWKIWKYQRPLLEQIHGPLPALVRRNKGPGGRTAHK
jgi:hypothetical protein